MMSKHARSRITERFQKANLWISVGGAVKRKEYEVVGPMLMAHQRMAKVVVNDLVVYTVLDQEDNIITAMSSGMLYHSPCGPRKLP